MSKRKTKYVDRIYFCVKKKKLYHVKWDHVLDKVVHWWFTDYSKENGYIKGRLVVPETWFELGWLPEAYIYDQSQRHLEKLKKRKVSK